MHVDVTRGTGRIRTGLGTLLLAALLAGAMLPMLVLAAAKHEPAPRTVGQAIAAVRLRDEPGKGARTLLRVPEGAELAILGKPKQGFYPAAYGAVTGWIATGSVETPAAPPADPVAAVDTLRKTQDVVSTARLNVRRSPAPDAPVIATLERGGLAAVTGRARDGYLELEVDGERGWALGQHLAAEPPSAGGGEGREHTYTRDEIRQIIYEAADFYGQDRADMLQVARCESDLVPTAVNSVGGSYGIFQFKPFTWDGTPYAEYDIFDPRANAMAAAWMWANGMKSHWVCQ